MFTRLALRVISVWMVAVSMAIPATCCAAEAADQLQAEIDRLAQPYLDNHVVMGMTIGVIRDGRSAVFGYGQFSSTDDRTPDRNTVFEIGSMSKVFTSLLLADAVKRGVVQLDDPAGKWLPEGVTMPIFGDRPIRLVDLATHVSGLPRLPGNFSMKDPENPYADYRVEDLYDFLKTCKLDRAPGEKSEYSNLGAGLLGVLLANAQHTTYTQLLAERITRPIGMKSTSVELSPKQSAHLASPHTADNGPTKNWDFPALTGAGAIRSTCGDLLLFAKACLKPPKSELGEAIDLAWKIHQQPIADGDFAMGLGWHVARDGATRWHNGQTGGYHSMILVNRDVSTAVVLLANTATGEVDQLAEDVMRSLNGTPVEPRSFEKSTAVPAEVLARYVGKYELAPGFIFTVSVNDGKLMVGLTGQPTFEVFARSETEWFYKVVEATITFKLDESGECTSLELFQNGVRQEARRLEP